jgi:hypothetical protein
MLELESGENNDKRRFGDSGEGDTGLGNGVHPKHTSKANSLKTTLNYTAGNQIGPEIICVNAGSCIAIQTTVPSTRLVGICPDDFASAVMITDHIDVAGTMSFLGHESETAPNLITSLRDAVASVPRSLLSDVLPELSVPDAWLAPCQPVAATQSSTTIAAVALAWSAILPTPKYLC